MTSFRLGRDYDPRAARSGLPSPERRAVLAGEKRESVGDRRGAMPEMFWQGRL